MTSPTPPIPAQTAADVAALPNSIVSKQTGELNDTGAVYRAIKAIVTWINAAKSAADLTVGFLAPARIADASLPIAKLDTDIATQVELNTAVDNAKSATNLTTGTLSADRLGATSIPLGKLDTDVATQQELDQATGTGSVTAIKIATDAVTTPKIKDGAVTPSKIGATGTPNASTVLYGDGAWRAPALSNPAPRDLTVTSPLVADDLGSSVRARNTAAAQAVVPLMSAPDGAMVTVARYSADISLTPGFPATTLQRLRTAGGLKARAQYSSLLLEAVRPPVPARPPMWAIVNADSLAALANNAQVTSITPDPAGLVALPPITPIGGQCPTVHRDASNGKVGLRFNGTSNVLPLTGAWLDLLRNRPNAVIFAVVLVTAAGISGHRTVVSFLTGNTATPAARAQLKWRDNGSGAAMALGRRLDSESASAATNGAVASSPALEVVGARFVWSSSDVYAYRNGVFVSSNTSFQTDGNTADTASVAAAIGAAGLGAAEFFSGTLLEAAIGEDTAGVVAAYQAYAEAKYGEEWLVSGDTAL